MALLNASTDRSQRPHHYIDLKTNPDVQVNGDVLTYTLQPVTDEEPGTYTASVWAVLEASGLVQTMAFVDLQIKTADVETQVVEKTRCAACHEGADSGKVYLHHIDPGFSPTGNWALDYQPVRSCKSCHNQDGYAAYRDPEGNRIPDPIVRRVHGVHMGEGLKAPENTDPVTGDFHMYTGVVFPAGVKNCTTCHVDDRWKTKPSRGACGACHDNTWFGDPSATPAGWENHPGGPQSNDVACAGCHPPDTGGVKAVAEAHAVEPPGFEYTVDLELSPPGNGTHYVAGEAPGVTVTVRDAGTGEVVDPATITEEDWERGYLFVSGPRAKTGPVLTTAAKDQHDWYPENDIRVQTDPATEDPKVSRTATSIQYQLDDVAGLAPGTYSVWVEVKQGEGLGGWQLLNFQVGTAAEEVKPATNCTDCHDDTRQHAGFFAVQFNPDICKSCHDYSRQFPGQVGWTPAGGWNGFGSAPIVKKVHGVHFGRYLNDPADLVPTIFGEPGDMFAEVIFPQDVRNCTKCHAGSTSWAENPSRLACLACHDSIRAELHASHETLDPTPQDPWSGDEVEMCRECHGPDRVASVATVHNISDPYRPPYAREPAEPYILYLPLVGKSSAPTGN